MRKIHYPYQVEAAEAVEDAWFRRGIKRPAIVIPTGGGKTTVFTRIADKHVRRTAHGRGRRVLTVAHRTELIEQAAADHREESPDLTVGIVKAGRNQTLADMVVGSVQTLRNPGRLRQLLDVGLIIVDECHHGAAASYRMILDAFPDALVLGVTATFSRGDGAGLGEVFTDVVYQVPISLLQQQGFLVHARGRRVGVPNLDLSKVKTTGGEYQNGQLDAALSASLAPQAIVRAVQEHAPHDSAVVFTPGVHFARVMHEAFDAAGFTSAYIHAKTSPDERRLTLKRVESGDIQIINNCGILTEGTNIPRLKTCVPKPTKSGGLYVQMAGRVLRKFGSYTHALILDPVGATAMHSLNARVELFGEDAAAAMERDPCNCWQAGGRSPVPNDTFWCSCGRQRCGEDCPCGGGGPGVCACTRPEKTERVETEAVPDEEPRVDGELFSVEVDLFHASRNHWLVTQGGTWFLTAGERFIALVPGRLRATWSAVVMRREPGGGSRYLVRDVPDKGYAMAWAEDELSGRELRTARKERSWRAKAPTQAQRAEAERLGLLPPDEVHGGQLADLIAVEQASRRMDETVAIMRGRQA